MVQETDGSEKMSYITDDSNKNTETEKLDDVISAAHDDYENYDILQNRENENDEFEKNIKNSLPTKKSSEESGT